MSTTPASLPYEEPGIETILVYSSFLLLNNAVNYILDRFIYCGLVGQLFIGVAYGTPGGRWLTVEAEEVIVSLGYLGLIMIVYEGGLSTDFPRFKANLSLSLCVALTGIGVPIGLAYVLPALTGATPLQSFAAGAALCSTSLGTTFTMLASSGLSSTRMGVVLTSAAMLDDVVGLVMTQVISSLGSGSSSIGAATIVRPILVSLAFAIVTPLVCAYVVKPLTVFTYASRQSWSSLWTNLASCKQTVLAVHAMILVGFVTGATYAGTSNLFAAYLAGACISWWDSESSSINTSDSQKVSNPAASQTGDTRPAPESRQPADVRAHVHCSGEHIYHAYYAQVVSHLLKPFFFASIGFSIPISRMFEATVVWQGIVFTLLMMLGKVVCGLWLVRLSVSWPLPRKALDQLKSMQNRMFTPSNPKGVKKPVKSSNKIDGKRVTTGGHATHHVALGMLTRSAAIQRPQEEQSAGGASPSQTSKAPHRPPDANVGKPLSLYPAFVLGLAMVARGEIGFLISSTAQSQGLFASTNADGTPSDRIFLVVTWAIMLCTIIGPLGVGLLVRRVKRLEAERSAGQASPLGAWGLSLSFTAVNGDVLM